MNSYNGFSPEQRGRALEWIKIQYASGARPPVKQCYACGQKSGALSGHSEDYSEPFGENIGKFHLCFICHMMIHCRHRSPRQWRQYRTAIRCGCRFQNYMTRNWPAFKAMFLQAVKLPPRHWSGSPPPWPGLLDEIESGDHDPRQWRKRVTAHWPERWTDGTHSIPGIPMRVFNALAQAEIVTPTQLRGAAVSGRLNALPNLGAKGLAAVSQWLQLPLRVLCNDPAMVRAAERFTLNKN